MECTQCKSDNVQRLSVIYQSGTQQINTTSRTYGGGAGSGFGFGGAATTTSGTSQSYLATKAAPPIKKKFKLTVLLLVIGVGIAMISGSFAFFLITAAIAAYLGYKDFQYNRNVYPDLRQVWLKSWHCNKCGTIYAE